MGRLSADGEARFLILDGEPLYTSEALEQIARRHAIGERDRPALRRVLEQAGRVYLDQTRLSARPSQLFRLRQDLRLGLRLLNQLTDLAPDGAAISAVSPADAEACPHAAALREGEREAPADRRPVGFQLAEAQAHLAYLRDVYEAALESTGRGVRGDEDTARIEARWRAPLIEFYTRTLARAWVGGPDGAEGERFLADCLAVLRGEALTVAPADADA